MVFMVPQYEISFTLNIEPHAPLDVKWVVNGEDDLRAIEKVLLWNGVGGYRVSPHGLDQFETVSPEEASA